MLDDPIERRSKEVRTHFALGTLDVNKLSAKDFLAITDITDMKLIEPIWIKERTGPYPGKGDWENIIFG